jgi:hypothetical protein
MIGLMVFAETEKELDALKAGDLDSANRIA